MLIRDIKYDGEFFLAPYVPALKNNVQAYFQKSKVEIPNFEAMGNSGVTWWFLRDWFTATIDHVIHGTIVIESFSGSHTDFGSVPKLLQGMISGTDYMLLMAFWFHDKMFQTQFFNSDKKGFESANELFYDIMTYYEVPKWKRDTIMDAVSSRFGWSAYSKREKRDAPQYQKCRITIKEVS